MRRTALTTERSCRHLLAAPPSVKTSSRAVVFGAQSSSCSVQAVTSEVHGNRWQATYVCCRLQNQLSSRAMQTQPQARSTQVLVRSNLRRGGAVGGTHLGLRQHGQTSRIVPEINRQWRVDDLTYNGSSETSRDGIHSPLSEQAGG